MSPLASDYLDTSRLDTKTLKCRAGNKQCGNRCVPRSSKCATEKDGNRPGSTKEGNPQSNPADDAIKRMGIGAAILGGYGIASAVEEARHEESRRKYWESSRGQGAGNSDRQGKGKDNPKTSTPWHSVLGVDPKASDAEVKRAYQEQAKKYHPDVYKGADATQKMQEINNARDEWKRQRRDSWLFMMGLK